MCGIAGYYLKDPQNTDLPPNKEREDFVNGLLKGIEYRGRDATGVVALQRASTQPHLEKADIEASEFIKWRKPLPWDSRIVLLHTRAATQGSPTNLDNNHPVVHKTCYVTHNGHIRNDDELFKDELFGLGERIAQVDSEVIPALIDKFGLDKVHLALQELEGGFAIAAVQPERYPDVLVLAKGRNSPLEFVETQQAIVWASTTGAIRDAWRGVWGEAPEVKTIQSLREGELLYIEDGKVEKLEFKVKQYTPTKTYSTTNTGNYSTSYGHESYLARFCNTKMHRATCVCKHSQWSHTGLSNGGWCIKNDCSCRQFVQGSFLTKREWRKQEVYKEVQTKRDELNKLRADAKKRKAEVSRRAAEKPETPRTMQGVPPVQGQLRLVYEKGTRKIYDDKKLVAVQFKCDGCDEYAPVLGSAQQGTYRFCLDCWGEECDMCGSFFDPDDVTEVDVGGDTVTPNKWYLCKGCYNTLNTATDETFEAAVVETAEKFEAPSGPSRGTIEGLVVDNMCVKLTAEDLDCKAAFLYELLFDMEPSEIKAEGWLENAYEIAKSTYRKNMADLRQGLPNATSKALAIRGSEDFSPRSVREAVEVGGESPNGEECGVRVFADE